VEKLSQYLTCQKIYFETFEKPRNNQSATASLMVFSSIVLIKTPYPARRTPGGMPAAAGFLLQLTRAMTYHRNGASDCLQMALPLSQEKPSAPSLLSALASNQADSSKEGFVYCPPYCPPKTEADSSVRADSRPERTVTGDECASGRKYHGKGGVRNILIWDIRTDWDGIFTEILYIFFRM
jgi:hypothetical protein